MISEHFQRAESDELIILGAEIITNERINITELISALNLIANELFVSVCNGFAMFSFSPDLF